MQQQLHAFDELLQRLVNDHKDLKELQEIKEPLKELLQEHEDSTEGREGNSEKGSKTGCTLSSDGCATHVCFLSSGQQAQGHKCSNPSGSQSSV